MQIYLVILARKLIIPKKQVADLKEYSLSNAPFEACSLLLGVVKNKIYTVRETYHMENLNRSINTFKMAGPDLIAAYEYSLVRKLDVIGIFHSHTLGIRPSMEDQIYMEINPVVWLIYSLSDCKFGAYILETSIRNILIDVIME
jgi:[CysO sulfur-carrier protein]-S-L-cysteine hydrolase